jgi:hypothetical protein
MVIFANIGWKEFGGPKKDPGLINKIAGMMNGPILGRRQIYHQFHSFIGAS